VVSLHNKNKLPGFISCGARKDWPHAPNVFPTLRAIRVNREALMADPEVKMLMSDLMELVEDVSVTTPVDAVPAGDEPQDDRLVQMEVVEENRSQFAVLETEESNDEPDDDDDDDDDDDGDDPDVVRGRAGSTSYDEKVFDDDSDDERRWSNELWETNARESAEEARKAAKRTAKKLTAPAAPAAAQGDAPAAAQGDAPAAARGGAPAAPTAARGAPTAPAAVSEASTAAHEAPTASAPAPAAARGARGVPTAPSAAAQGALTAPAQKAPASFPAPAAARGARGASQPDSVPAAAPAAAQSGDGDESEPELQVGMIISADDNLVVKKGTFGQILSIEPSKQFGLVEWETSNGGRKLGAPKQAPERVAFEGRFKYIVEDPEELLPLAQRSGLPAVASLHGQPLFEEDAEEVDRTGCFLTHAVPDFGALQPGAFLTKQLGFASGYIYSGDLRVRKPSSASAGGLNNSDAQTETTGTHPLVPRLRPGQVFFEYKGINSEGMIPSVGVDEMYVFVGVVEEYQLQNPIAPGAASKVHAPALLGYRFKRCRVDGTHKLCWQQATSRSIEHEPADVLVSAIKLTRSTARNVYVVDGDHAMIFGNALFDMFNDVLCASSLYAAHREHGLLSVSAAIRGETPADVLVRAGQSYLHNLPGPLLKKLLISIHAQLLYAVASSFQRQYEGVAKASPAMVLEITKSHANRNAAELATLRKHVLWMLTELEPAKLRELMMEVTAKIPELTRAAHNTLNLPAKARGQVQDEIQGPREAPNMPPPPAKKPKTTHATTPGAGGLSLDDMIRTGKGGTKPKAPSPEDAAAPTPASDLAAQLAAQLQKFPSEEKLNSLTSQVTKLQENLNKETLRADREQQRADGEAAKADALRNELAALRARLDSSSTDAAAAKSQGQDALVKALNSEIESLRRQNAGLIMLLGDDKASAASILSGVR